MLNNESTVGFESLETPFYYYDIELLRETLQSIFNHAKPLGYHVHYAVKANANQRILREIAMFGLGADCVSGNEVKLALQCGFAPRSIVFAGVGKTDREIEYAVASNIFCFHCESVQELTVIDQIARSSGKRVNVALRLNPNVDAHTHAHITTGLLQNKFGLTDDEVAEAKRILPELRNINLIGLHFHIGSQILDMAVFRNLAEKINAIMQDQFAGYRFTYLNVGGGLGIDYQEPWLNPIPNFAQYFGTFRSRLRIDQKVAVHFELGRSVVGQCGSLVTRVTYLKGTHSHRFAVVDAGMNDLIRPALYGASHHISCASRKEVEATLPYDVVGPVCESADCFGRQIELPPLKRGDLLAIHSSGAYGEVMGSRYNMREFTHVVFSDELRRSAELCKAKPHQMRTLELVN
jgi:diaminopimelate decarboxylase